jgi:cell division protein FtsL
VAVVVVIGMLVLFKQVLLIQVEVVEDLVQKRNLHLVVMVGQVWCFYGINIRVHQHREIYIAIAEEWELLLDPTRQKRDLQFPPFI